MQETTYTRLVEAARAGEAAAYEELYRRTSHRMMGLALSMVKQEQDALDLLQESYLYAFGKLEQLEQPEYFSTWLYRLVANRCKNFLTRTRPKLFAASLTDREGEEWELEDQDPAARPEESADDAETRRLVMEMVDDLPEDQRICVLLHYYQEKTVSEIAGLLEVPENTVKSRLNYARKKLRVRAEALERQGTLLRGAAFGPLLTKALRDSVAHSLAVGGPAVLEGVLQGAGVAATAAGTATASAAAGGGGSGAAGFLGTVVGKVTAGIVVTALAVGGAAALLSRPDPPPQPQPEPQSQLQPQPEPESQPEPEPEPASDLVSLTFLFLDQEGNAVEDVVAVGIRIGGYTVVLDDRVIGRESDGLYSDQERADGQAIITAAQAGELGLLQNFSHTATSLRFDTREAVTPMFHYQRESGSNSISRRVAPSGDQTIVVRRHDNTINFEKSG